MDSICFLADFLLLSKVSVLALLVSPLCGRPRCDRVAFIGFNEVRRCRAQDLSWSIERVVALLEVSTCSPLLSAPSASSSSRLLVQCYSPPVVHHYDINVARRLNCTAHFTN